MGCAGVKHSACCDVTERLGTTDRGGKGELVDLGFGGKREKGLYVVKVVSSGSWGSMTRAKDGGGSECASECW